MKKAGWILYYKKDFKKNQRFVEIVTESLEREGIETKVVLLDDIEIDKYISEEIPDFVVNRSRNAKVAKVLEHRGIRVFNCSKVTEIANDKEKTYEYLKNDVPFMPVLREKQKKFPYIMKSCRGHGGKQVYLITNKQEEEQAKRKLENQKYICQEYCNEPGKDLRVYVINKGIVVSVLREAERGFKSNYSLGGKATEYNLSEEEKRVVYKILEKLDMDYGGIDFIFHNHKIMFNEIEDAVGARMVYENTNIDILKMFAMYVAEEI